MSAVPQKGRPAAPARRPAGPPGGKSVPSRSTPVRRTPPRRPSQAPRPVPPPRRARRRPLAFYVFASFVVGSLVLGLTVLNAVLAQGSFRIADLSKRVDGLQQQVERRQLEVAQLSAPDRIAAQARKLGMVLPATSRIQVIHLPAPADRAAARVRPRPEKAVGGSG